MSAAINSDEEETNRRIDRQRQDYLAFGVWWREWAPPRAIDTEHMRLINWEAFKAGAAMARAVLRKGNE